jgi:hypothetical protein
VNGSRQPNDRVSGLAAVIGRKRDVSGAMVERGLTRRITFAAFFFLPLHLIGSAEQRLARKPRLSSINVPFCVRQRAADDVVEVCLGGLPAISFS